MKKSKRFSLLTAASVFAACAYCGIATAALSGERSADADTTESVIKLKRYRIFCFAFVIGSVIFDNNSNEANA